MSIATPDTKRRALGKGLDSLLPRVQPPSPAPGSQEGEGGKPREIALELIDRNPFQTRSHVAESELAELAASIVAKVHRDALLVALRRLPMQQRAAVVLRYYNDMSQEEIAQVLDCPVGTVNDEGIVSIVAPDAAGA